MILPDTNIWLALALSTHEFHTLAREWVASQSRPASILFCRSTQHSFLRLLTTESVLRLYGIPPMSNHTAWQIMERFLAGPLISFAPEPRNIETRWKNLAARKTASPKLWMDAYLAAFALAAGYQLLTIDKAFTQFKDLHPLILTPDGIIPPA